MSEQAETAPVNAIVQSHGWQPIESIPKDGQWVLVFRKSRQGGREIQTARWQDGELGGFGWCYCSSHFPTHWMPMPDTPTV